MIRFKYIAAALALIGAVGSANATNTVKQDQIQFMTDEKLSEVQGAYGVRQNQKTGEWYIMKGGKLSFLTAKTLKNALNEYMN